MIRSRIKTVRKGASRTLPPNFWAPFTDSGSGVLNTTLSRGTGSITWTRAGATGTTILSSGLVSSTIAANTGRSYYDPTTLQYLGGLLEEARTNLCIRSQELDNAAWSKSSVTITANADTAPDGTSTADRVVEVAASAVHLLISTDVTFSASAQVVISAFVKQGNLATSEIYLVNTGATRFAGIKFTYSGATVSAGTTAPVGYSVASSGVQTLPNGYYRIWAVINTVTDTVAHIEFYPKDTTSYLGNTSNYTTAWGFDAQVGAFLTTYIPTTAATVTRAADVATCPISGNIDQTVGSAFCRFMVAQQNPSVGQSCISNDSGAGIGYIYVPAAASTLISTYDGTTVTSSGVVSDFRGIPTRAAASWGGATKSIYVNGSNKGSGAFDGSYNGTVLYIGNSGASNVLNGCIRDIRIWQRVLSDSQIASIR